MLNLLRDVGWRVAVAGAIVLFMLVFAYVVRTLLVWVSAL